MEEGKHVQTEINESVAFSLLEDLLKSQDLSRVECEYLKNKFSKSYHQLASLKKEEIQLSKTITLTSNEISNEKIVLEKARLEENQEIQALRRLEEKKGSLQKDLELSEQKEIMAKFELTELKRLHDDLVAELEVMKNENTNIVNPVLNQIRDEIQNLTGQFDDAGENLAKESSQKDILVSKVTELEKLLEEKKEHYNKVKDSLHTIENEPERLKRQVEAITRAHSGMEAELRSLNRKLKGFEADIDIQTKRKLEVEKLRKSLLEKMEVNRQTMEAREQDVAAVRKNLDLAKARNHELVIRKMELNLQKKEMENDVRHKNDLHNVAKKDYDNLKRQLKKKRSILDSIKQVLPQLEEQVVDQELSLRSLREDSDRKGKAITGLKNELDMHVAIFLQQEGIEQSKRKELEAAIQDVDHMEGEVAHWVTEGRRQGKLLSVLSAQRDIKGRESARMSEKEKESKQHVKIKEMVILDLTKRCNEVANRLKEFSALYEVVKNERNKYVNLIQSSTQALAEMREKIRILNNEVEILGNESGSKDSALVKERTAHLQAQHQRDALRQDMNRLLSDYRAKQGTVEQQIQEIDKLNIVISALEREMLEIKGKYEKAVEERNITGVQLIDRNDELCILYERCNQQQEALKKGEVHLQEKEDELRFLRLQCEELRRHYEIAKRKIPEVDRYKEKISQLEKSLIDEKHRTDDLSLKLEDPQNLDRWRPLDGEDPDSEQLSAKMQVLEDRLDEKREQLVEKELILEEVAALTEKLRLQALSKRDGAKSLADSLNSLQSRIRDVTKTMLATVSELSMYQATALRLQQEKIYREKVLEESKWRLDHGEAPFEEAIKEWEHKERRRMQEIERSMKKEEELRLAKQRDMEAATVKTTAEPRPTAYIPDELGIPKPYGQMAPFKPSEAGSTMRFIRPPEIKPIEI